MITVEVQPFSLRALPPDITELSPLQSGEVQLWYGRFDSFGQEFLEECQRVLSEEETQRMSRYFFEKDRRQFLISRGILRKILGRYLSIDSRMVELRFEKFGKPFLQAGQLYFNLAHCKNNVMIGFSTDREIGVDLEKLALNENRMLPLIRNICSPRERELIGDLRPEETELALTRLWTAKEACLKALGCGLQIPPNTIEIEERVLRGDSSKSEMAGLPEGKRVAVYPLPELETSLGSSAALAILEGP